MDSTSGKYAANADYNMQISNQLLNEWLAETEDRMSIMLFQLYNIIFIKFNYIYVYIYMSINTHIYNIGIDREK